MPHKDPIILDQKDLLAGKAEKEQKRAELEIDLRLMDETPKPTGNLRTDMASFRQSVDRAATSESSQELKYGQSRGFVDGLLKTLRVVTFPFQVAEEAALSLAEGVLIRGGGRTSLPDILGDVLNGRISPAEAAVRLRDANDARPWWEQLAGGLLVPIPFGAALKGARFAFGARGVGETAASGFARRGIPGGAAGASALEEVVGDLRSARDIVISDFATDNWGKVARGLAHIPGLRLAINLINPSALVKTPGAQAALMQQILYDEVAQKVVIGATKLERFGAVEKLFGKFELQKAGKRSLIAGQLFGRKISTGIFADGPFKGKRMADLRARPQDFRLSSPQREWIDTINKLDEGATQYMRDNGLNVPLMELEEGTNFVGRVVLGRIIHGPEGVEFLEAPRFLSKPGVKAGFERARVFDTLEEAAEKNFFYVPDEVAVTVKMREALRRVADERVADWLFKNHGFRDFSAPASLVKEVQALHAGILRRTRAALNLSERFDEAVGRAIKVKSVREIMRGLAKASKQDFAKVDELISAGDAKVAEMVGELRSTIDTGIAATRKEASKGAAREKRIGARLLGVREELELFSTRLDELAPVLARKTESLRRARISAQGIEGKFPGNMPAFERRGILVGPTARETVSEITEIMGRRQNKILKGPAELSSLARFFSLGADFSVAFIQGILLLGQPRIFAKTSQSFVKAVFDPDFNARMISSNSDLIARNPGLIISHGGGTEFTQAIARGGLVNKFPFSAYVRFFKPFQRGFESSLDTAGIELTKAFEHIAVRGPAARQQVSAFVNEMRGLISTSRIGVSPVQAQIESMSVLAPRYNRAIAAILFDLFHGNIRGALARRALAKATAGVSLVFATAAVANGDSPDELLDHFIPIKDGRTNPNFMTIEIAGQRIGPGSKILSVMRMLSASSLDPDRLAELSMRNPALRFMRGNLGPIPSTSLDILTGRDYVGDPTNQNVLQLSERVVRDNLVPIWMQSMFIENDGMNSDPLGGAVRGVGDFFGLRAFRGSPFAEWIKYIEDSEKKLSDSEWRKNYGSVSREEYAISSVDDLPPQRKKFYQVLDPIGSDLWTKFKDDQNYRGRVNKVLARGTQFRAETLDTLRDHEKAVREGRISLQDYRAFDRDLWFKYGGIIDALRKLPEFKKEVEILEERDLPEQPSAVAWQQYQAILHDPELNTDEGFDFDARTVRLEDLQAEVGLDRWQDIQEAIEIDRGELPLLSKRLREDRDLLQSYWQLIDNIAPRGSGDHLLLKDWQSKSGSRDKAQFVRENPSVRRLIARLDLDKERMRRRRPEIDAALMLWYGGVPLTRQAQQIAEEFVKNWQIALDNSP